jgi:pantothenate kinase
VSTVEGSDPSADLVAAATRLASGPRRLLGITGPPGAGKSVLARELMAALGDRARLVPMDGFHLTDDELRRLDRLDRKGAPDTFDAAGFVALLRRLRANAEDVVRAPEFDRVTDAPVPEAIAVPRETPLVITEGIYLLLDEPPWDQVRPLLDECWYLAPDEEQRVQWLVDRHVRYGRTPDAARLRATAGSDAHNAELIAAGRHRADRIVRLPAQSPSSVDDVPNQGP